MKVIALTIGDPNGIGPEIAIKASAALAADDRLRPIIVGDVAVVGHYHRMLAPDLKLVEIPVGEKPLPGVLNFMPVDGLPTQAFVPGQVEAEAGRATISYVEAAIRLVRTGGADAIVACPHSETSVNAAGIAFSGYPGLLARLTGQVPEDVFLMLVGGGLRILHVTLHERLADALARLTPELVVKAGKAAVTALAAQGVETPRIGLFGINPHAGEGGLFGDDDRQITEPAAKTLREAGIAVEGPLGADVFLARRDLDGYIAMFHDQGHVPVKLIAPRSAAALSVGAGIIFSSVGHGCAFDIAGRGEASPDAVLRSLRLVAGLSEPGMEHVP